MSAKLWLPGDPLEASRHPLYFRESDKAAAFDAIAKFDYFGSLVVVKPNGEGILGAIHAYLTSRDRHDLSWIYSLDLGDHEYPLRHILLYCSQLIRGVQHQCSEKISAACDELINFLSSLPAVAAARVPPGLLTAVQCLRDFSTECLFQMEHGAPFVHVIPIQANKSWWTSTPVFVANMPKIRKSIKTVFDWDRTGSQLHILESWFKNMNARLLLLRSGSTGGVQRQKAIQEASAYCAALAERYLLQAKAALALLLLHRSSDLLLFSICAGNGAIDFSTHGGRYVSSLAPSPPKPNKIHLLTSLEVAERGNMIVPNVSRTNALKGLNEWRNLLMHTHYMSDVEDKVAIALFGSVRQHLESLGGSEWKLARETYLASPPIALSALLDLNGAVSGAFTEL